MQHETLMLKGLFAACLLSCVLVLGAMFTTRITVAPAGTTLANATHCAVNAATDVCPLPRG